MLQTRQLDVGSEKAAPNRELFQTKITEPVLVQKDLNQICTGISTRGHINQSHFPLNPIVKPCCIINDVQIFSVTMLPLFYLDDFVYVIVWIDWYDQFSLVVNRI